jgi:hypothetical protein
LAKKNSTQKTEVQKSKILTTLFISLKVAHSGQEAPTKISARWLIKKLKTIEERFKGIGCAPALLGVEVKDRCPIYLLTKNL